jgi:putative copper resistance protein D
MIDAAVIALRLLQYVSGSILMGSALFLVYAWPGDTAALRWPKPLLSASALVLAVSTAFGLVAQTIQLAGSVELGLTSESLQAVIGTMGLGKAALVRANAGVVAALVLLMPRRRSTWALSGALGTLAVTSFAWMGHGAATEGGAGTLHLLADIVHALTAATWIGALIAFVLLVRTADRSALLIALNRFSAIGGPLVALLAASGLVNGWFLVGPYHLGGLFTTPYGRLLLLKLALVVGMLGLAAANRWRHTPELERRESKAAVRRSVTFEAVLGLLVLALVAWFGMLEPPGLA